MIWQVYLHQALHAGFCTAAGFFWDPGLHKKHDSEGEESNISQVNV